MSHGFTPITTGEAIQVAILDELQKITSLLEPSQEPADMEPASEPTPATGEPEEKPVPKPPAKKAATRKRVTGQ